MESQLWQFLGSLAGVGLLVLLVHLTGFSEPAKLQDLDEATEIARLTPEGFEPIDIALDQHHQAAICCDLAGEIVLITPHGAQFIPSRLASWRLIDGSGDVLTFVAIARPATRVALGLGNQAAAWRSKAAKAQGAHHEL